jgi:hypothetical protein
VEEQVGGLIEQAFSARILGFNHNLDSLFAYFLRNSIKTLAK